MTEPVHRIEIIKALALCWNAVTEDGLSHSADGGNTLEFLMEGLKTTGMLLVKAVEGEIDIKSELEPLLRADPTLTELFAIRQTIIEKS
jgi:hypothetical protein